MSYCVIQGLFVIYSAMMVMCVNMEVSNVHTGNTLERHICWQIQDEIDYYEAQSGEQVEKIGVVHYRDEGEPAFNQANFQFYGPYYYSSHLILYTTWSDVDALNYFNQKDYERFDMSEAEVKEYFDNIDPKEFGTFNPHKQLTFRGDTMYWAIY